LGCSRMTGDFLIELKTSYCALGTALITVGLLLRLFTPRELITALVLSAIVAGLVSLMLMSGYLVRYAGKRIAGRSRSFSPSVTPTPLPLAVQARIQFTD
jgi:hypothetical protein